MSRRPAPAIPARRPSTRATKIDPPPPLLPPRASADGTHRRLLEEALRRFGERGFHGVSVREIAEGVGVRASSLYAHLASKEQVLFELVLIGHEEHHDLLSTALLEAGPDPVTQIRAVMQAHVRMHATYPLLARVCNRELAALTPASLERVLITRTQSEGILADVIERGMRQGAFRVDDTWLAVAALGAMGIRVADWWRDDLDYDVDDVARMYAEFAVRLLHAAD
jgi:AcrR family transcriptional regulator